MTKAEEQKQTAASNQQIVVFKLGQEEYGMPIDQIKEVVITPTITKMPQTPEFVKGVANIRGNIIAILDLETKFGLPPATVLGKRDNNFTLVIESEDHKMGVLVKEVPNTLSIARSSIEESVFASEGFNDQNYITGIVKVDKRLIIMIDIFKVIAEDSKQIFRKQATTA